MRRSLLVGALLMAAVGLPAARAENLTPPEVQWVRTFDRAQAITAVGERTITAGWDGIVALDGDGAVDWMVAVTNVTFTGIEATADGGAYAIGQASNTSASASVGSIVVPGHTERPFLTHVDADGTVDWVVGRSDALVTMRGLAVVGDGDVVIVAEGQTGSGDLGVERYDDDGNLTWATPVDVGGIAPGGIGIATDPDGRVVLVAGVDDGATIGEGPDQLTVPDDPDTGPGAMAVATFDADGTPAWVHAFNDDPSPRGGDVGVDCDGRITVAGEFHHRLRLDGQDVQPAVLGGQVFLAQLAPDGSLTWAQDVDGDLEDVDLDVACGGDVHLTGVAESNLGIGDLGDRVVTRVRTEREGNGLDEVGVLGLAADGSPRYGLVLPDLIAHAEGPRLAEGTAGLRLLVEHDVDNFDLGPVVGGPTDGQTAVVGLDPAGPGDAPDPHVGAEFAWATTPAALGGPGGTLLEHRRGVTFIAAQNVDETGDVDRDRAGWNVSRVGPGGSIAWTVEALGNGLLEPVVNDLAVDARGGVYAIGSWFGELRLTNRDGTEASVRRRPGSPAPTAGFIAHWSADGRLLWSRDVQAAQRTDDAHAALWEGELAPDGGVVVAGPAGQGRLRYGPGRSVIDPGASGRRLVLVRYRADGTPRWARSHRGTLSDLEVLPNGDMYELGHFWGRLELGPEVLRMPGTERGGYVALVDGAGRRRGGLSLYEGRPGTGNAEFGFDDLVADDEGNTYLLGGGVRKVQLLPDQDGPTIQFTHERSHAVMAISWAGSLNWVRTLGADAGGFGDIELDPRGGVVLAGTMTGTAHVADQDLDLTTSDLVLARLTADGDVHGAVFDGNALTEQVRDVAVLGNGDVLVSAWGGDFGANRPEELHVEDEYPKRLVLVRYLGGQL